MTPDPGALDAMTASETQPEQAAPETDGHAAFEAFYTAFGGTVPDWPPIGMEGGREAWEAAARAVADRIITACQWCGNAAKRCPDCGTPLTVLHHDPACSLPCGACETPKVPGGGEWLAIAFMGHIEYTGYVTEVTKNGQPAYRIDLPEKVWGGNPLAYVTHAASSWFSDHPVTEESVRAAWEAQQERARERAQWANSGGQRALALAAGTADDYWDDKGPF